MVLDRNRVLTCRAMMEPPSLAPRARKTLSMIADRTASLLASGQPVATMPAIAEQLVKELAKGALPTPRARRALDLAEEHAHRLG